MSNPGPAQEFRPLNIEGNYEVSCSGHVVKMINAHHKERRQRLTIRPEVDKDGYHRVQIRHRHYFVHRLVYEAFCGPLLEGLVVCHSDGSRDNNHFTNLSQDTQRENISHKIPHGTHQAGEKHGRSLCSDAEAADVRQSIRAARRTATGRIGKGVCLEIAEQHAVSVHLVYDLSRKTKNAWGHI